METLHNFVTACLKKKRLRQKVFYKLRSSSLCTAAIQQVFGAHRRNYLLDAQFCYNTGIFSPTAAASETSYSLLIHQIVLDKGLHMHLL